MWLCHVHNLINERLGKPEFDCLLLDEIYDCGCGPEGNTTAVAGAPTAGTGAAAGAAGAVAAAALLPHADWERDAQDAE